jgi:hydroxymethylglutaryl-CoA lyase
MDLPESVELIEVGPRDGFQSERTPIPTRVKQEIIACLAKAGLREIQAVSFVHPERVPQMADAEELLLSLPESQSTVYTGLVLNPRGLDRALASGVKRVEISVSVSDAHSRSNAGLSSEQALREGVKMIEQARARGLTVRGSLQCAFGCVHEGFISGDAVVESAARLIAAGANWLALSDTTGMADPLQVSSLVSRVAPCLGDVPLILHLHDTRGLGLVNLMAGLQSGVTRFDTSLGGMGGCPFMPGAAGNIATEDTAYLLQRLNVATGVSLSAVLTCTERMESFLDRTLPARMSKKHLLAGC